LFNAFSTHTKKISIFSCFEMHILFSDWILLLLLLYFFWDIEFNEKHLHNVSLLNLCIWNKFHLVLIKSTFLNCYNSWNINKSTQ
jgi:hypothetical protein